MTLLLSVIFVVSGAAGLFYESIWSRYLGLFVGHSAYAQVIVLVIFLGGMSGGAAITARFSARLREPLIWYAGAEAIVGVMGLLFHDVFTSVSAFAYSSIFPALAGGWSLLIVKWSLAAALILPQSILLGATFPLMTTGILRRQPAGSESSGRILGILYFANSLGAAAGVLLAGFWMIRVAGLPGTILAAAIANLVVALATFGAVRFERDQTDDDEIASGSAEGTDVAVVAAEASVASTVRDQLPLPTLWRLLLGVSFGTAVASFIYEIAWIRMLSLVLGSATHSFELMLSAFILGLALGAWWIRGRADSVRDPMQLLGVVQFAMGVLAILTLGLYVRSYEWTAWLLGALDRSEGGYTLFTLARYLICLAVMLPATFCAGITLPLITRMLLGAGSGERAIGSVYSVNTLGSILGVALASLVLLPWLGVRTLLIVGGSLDLLIGVLLLWVAAQRRPALRRTAVLASAGGVLVVAGTLIAPSFDPGLLSSGVFRYGVVPARGSRTILYYKDGRTASVSVRQGSDSGYSLATNGKPDASLSRLWFEPPAPGALPKRLEGDESTQVLLPLVTLAHVPQAERAAVIGQGSGLSSHFLLGSPRLKSLVTIDIEPSMVEASRLFKKANHRVFDDPRSRFVFDDAKSYFAAAGTKYDLILSEPSNPWVSGVSGLFTDEFYQQVKRYLTPNGVFGQWLHLYEIDDGLVLSVVKALHRNFASYEIFLTNDVDILVVASNAARMPRADWSVVALPEVRKDLARFEPLTPEALEATRVVTRAELDPLIRDGVGANSDFYPTLDLGAERARYLRGAATGFMGMTQDRFDIAAAMGGRRIGPSGTTKAPLGHQRVVSLALASRLASGESLSPADTTVRNRSLQGARMRYTELDRDLTSGAPPADWFFWFTKAILVERDLGLGSSGIADTTFHGRVERYLLAEGAPEDGIAAWRFLRAVAHYDWRAAARETDAVLAAHVANRRWLPPEFALDAIVMTRIKVGDPNGARLALVRLGNASSRKKEDLRSRLLEAYVQLAERVVAGQIQ